MSVNKKRCVYASFDFLGLQMIRFRLKELMADKGFKEDRRVTFDEISKATGIHRTTLTKVANQKGYNASTDIVDKLCDFFQVSVGDLLVHIHEPPTAGDQE